MAIVMSNELGEEGSTPGEKDQILKSEVEPVFWSADIIVTGESAGKKEVAKEFPMQCDFLLLIERIFFEMRTIDENFVGIN